jgi:ATP-dependent DNA helicase UvrD/PcrA
MTMKWSKQLTAIFTWMKTGRGNARVTARAGTGKTTTIIEAINHAPESQILVCAFNKEIADELSRRLKNPKASARTLHSIGNGIVYKNVGNVQIDKDRGKKVAKKALQQCFPKMSPNFDVINCVKDLVSKAKGMAPFATISDMEKIADQFDLYPSQESAEAGWEIGMIVKSARVAMDLAKTNDGSIDYDDMIYLPLANNWARPRFDLIVVDEAQDMNYSQLLLAQRVSRGRIMVVGDDRQAIYGFRGADSGSLDRLKATLKTKELKLTVTYRCPKKIVELANEVVEDFEAAPSAPEGTIDEIAYHAVFAAAAPGDFILSRTNAPLAKTCLQLVRDGKRAIIRGRDFGERLVALVRKIEATTMEELFSGLKTHEDTMVSHFQALADEDTEEKMQLVLDQTETIRQLCQGLATPDEVITRISKFFVADRDADLTLGAAITLSTVHKAKGLESDRVFILKDSFKRRKQAISGEEANIWYVAVTRAKKHLTWLRGGVETEDKN